MKFDEVFTSDFVKCHAGDVNLEPCYEKVMEETEEFIDAYDKYEDQRKNFKFFGDTTVEELEKAELEMCMELMDMIQAGVTMLGHMEKKKIFNKDIIEQWKAKQKDRRVKYNVR